MSFGYPQMGSNPLHPMHHLLANSTNGFMQLSHSSLNPLAASLNQMAALANQAQQMENAKKNVANQSVTAGSIPMDLEMNEPKERDVRINNQLQDQRKEEPLLELPDQKSAAINNMLQSENSNRRMSPLPSPFCGLDSNMMFNQQLMGASFMMMPGMMMHDPALLNMQQFSMMGNTQTPNQPAAQPTETAVTPAVPLQPVKEIITCKTCTLFPPNPNTPPPTTRERPLGCRTVFVGGLPENCTEQILNEVFERCGEITSMRLSVKNFCHIRFVYEASVDSAIYLSGYRLRINPQHEVSNCGRLHVDYAQARDDQYEYECRQRQLQREQRHRSQKNRQQRNSPPLIVHYTEHESASISEKLKSDESFVKAVLVLVAWLERGECSKRNSNTFYSMIQSTNSHVRRLSNEKYSMEEQLEKAKAIYKKQMQGLLSQFTQIEKVFNAASHKKVWDHFTKAQRKNIDVWKKQSLEMRSMQLTDIQDEDEMEMSDDERDSVRPSPSKRTRYDNDKLKEENDSLKCQLQAYKNEVNLVKSDVKSDVDIKIQQIQVLQETIRNMQTQLLENKSREKENLIKIHDLEAKLREANVKQLLLKTKIINASTKNPTSSKNSEADESEVTELMLDSPLAIVGATDQKITPDLISSPQLDAKVDASLQVLKAKREHRLDLAEARVIGLVSTFLAIHPLGASTDQLLEYVNTSTSTLSVRKELEETLSRFQNLFQEEPIASGVKNERKWKFRGFQIDVVKKADNSTV